MKSAIKRKLDTDEGIAFGLRQAEAGTPMEEAYLQMGMLDPTIDRWQKVFVGMGAETRRLMRREKENQKPEQLVADPSLYKTMP